MIAAELQAKDAAGERVLLAHRSAASYVCGLFGALYAGAIPVSAHPLERTRLASTLGPLAAIAAASRARFAIAPSSTAELAKALAAQAPELSSIDWLTAPSGARPRDFKPEWVDDPEATAYVQYTSGSTGPPKGVMLTHANILANLTAHCELYEMGPDSRIVTWLPLSHDMGFIGPVFHPQHLGLQTVFLAPEAFLLKPVRWLRAISHYGGTISGAPNFAYDLCVDRITFDELDDLDLGSWATALNGAEPVRPTTLRRFISAFASVGFRAQTMAPAFGLAECTCMASSATGPQRPSTRWFARSELRRGEIVELDRGADEGIELVACGSAPSEHRIEIVSAVAERLQDGFVGEIWVQGPSVAKGYLEAPQETARVFGATLRDEPDSLFLRTGDLGFRLDGELFVTGRVKELIVIRGENYAPDQIELISEASHPQLGRHACAAFSLDLDGEERLVIVHELISATPEPAAAQAIRVAVAESLGIRAWSVVLLAPGALPVTSTGKIRRSECRERFCTGTLRGTIYADGRSTHLQHQAFQVTDSRDSHGLLVADRFDPKVTLDRDGQLD